MKRGFACPILIILSDQFFKFLILNKFQPGQSIPVIKPVFYLTLVFNKGGAFGLLAWAGWLFILVSAAAIIYIAGFLLKSNARYNIKIASACIMSGAVSNLIDRLRFGYVVDFFDFRVWPVFNIADSAITIGVLYLCIRYFLKSGR
ncbi:MAG: signal peptidase II [Candidatus Omnitrophica bacterium CG10_big_fil_rev_8_21_14_0_10_43_8]|nr:MAG: signal peptidase II [Candidatus Omnitrophica bacterium CG10_big_fil_rev_8_21_14_0_10_43_8]